MTRATTVATGLPALLLATTIGGCAAATSLQPPETVLAQAARSVQRAEADGAIRYAPDEFLEAKDALSEAEFHGGARGRQDAYRAWQLAEIASARARSAAAQEQIATFKTETAQYEAERQRYEAEAEAARQQRAKQLAEAATAEALARAEAAAAAKERALREKAAAELRAAIEAAEKEQALQSKAELEEAKQALETRLREAAQEIAQVREEKRGLIISLSDILFDFGKATLLPGTQSKLAQLAAILSAYPDRRIAVEGHTDNVGSNAFNLQLSEARAESVRSALITKGINPAMITAVGFGKSKPVASNDTASGRQQNRRVEIVVLTPPAPPAAAP